MKVLHVIDTLGFGGGAEHALRLQLPPLAERGIWSVVVCLRQRQGPLAGLVREEGTDVEVLIGRSRGRSASDLRARIRAFEPQLVHATLFDSCLASRLATPSGLPLLNSLVSTSYAPVRTERLGASPVKRRVVQCVDMVSARRVNHFHALTKAVADHAQTALRLHPDSITIIPRGRSSAALGMNTPTRRATVRRALGIEDEAPIVITVGRQEPAKGQATLISAFAVVRDRFPDAVLIVVGQPGAASAEVQRSIAEHGLADAVRVLGHRTDVADLLVASDIFAFPSFYEGLGSALIEAMALSLPIVASDIPAVREVLAEGECGVLVEPGDQRRLAHEIIDLLLNARRRSLLTLRASARFSQRFELDAVADATASLYERMVMAS